MIVCDNTVPKEPVQPVNGVADDRGPNVADMHWLGHVGAGVVHHDRMPFTCLGDPKLRIGFDRRDGAQQPCVSQEDIDESGTRDFQTINGLVSRRVRNELFRYCAGRLLKHLGQRHCSIALVVTKLRVGGLNDANP